MFSFKPKIICFAFNREQYVSLHMFFVFFPIDVIFLNKKLEVVDIKKKFMPFSPYYSSSKKCAYVIETPFGYADKLKLEINDILKIS
jgi:hypothetical protein